MDEIIAKIMAVRDQLETLVIPANDHNTLTIYGSRQILQDVANMLRDQTASGEGAKP